jgi:hypothetical protein
MAYAAYVLFLRRYPRELVDRRDRDMAPQRALWVPGIFLVVIASFWIAHRVGLA